MTSFLTRYGENVTRQHLLFSVNINTITFITGNYILRNSEEEEIQDGLS
jgi:hypothetical protein